MEFINQYSFTIIAGILIVIFSALIFRRGIGQTQVTALLALFLGFLLAYWFFNPGEGSSGGAKRAQAAIGAGTPVLLEFQSPY
jgi:uncharacterized membrane protein